MPGASAASENWLGEICPADPSRWFMAHAAEKGENFQCPCQSDLGHISFLMPNLEYLDPEHMSKTQEQSTNPWHFIRKRKGVYLANCALSKKYFLIPGMTRSSPEEWGLMMHTALMQSFCDLWRRMGEQDSHKPSAKSDCHYYPVSPIPHLQAVDHRSWIKAFLLKRYLTLCKRLSNDESVTSLGKLFNCLIILTAGTLFFQGWICLTSTSSWS